MNKVSNKWKNISLMVVVFASLMICCSTLIYGRFTRQFNPEVSQFGVSIASQENMMISSSGEMGTFSDYVKLEELVSNKAVTLSPLTGKIVPTIDETYEELTLTDDGNVASDTKYLKFSLYFLGSSDMNLYLKGSRGGEVINFDDSTANHHFTLEERTRLSKNLRIAFLSYSTTYQPSGFDTNVVYSDLPISAKVYSQEVVTSANYTTFNSLGYTNTVNDVVLATTKKQEVSKMDVVIWLEEDGLGILEALCNLTLSLRFEAVLVNN
jgi:hypothetical protein